MWLWVCDVPCVCFWHVRETDGLELHNRALMFAVSHIPVISGIATSMGQESGDRAPGDFGIDPFNLGGNPAKKAKLELQEIKNGRLAMWAAAGMIMQGVTTDGGAIDNLFVSCTPETSRRFCSYNLSTAAEYCSSPA